MDLGFWIVLRYGTFGSESEAVAETVAVLAAESG